jgi:hypothetical protein
MSIEVSQFRIIPDPKNPKLWAYEPLAHASRVEPVGGFRSAKEARRAFNRVKHQWDARK